VRRWSGRGSALAVPRAWEVWLHRMQVARCRLPLDAAGGWTRSAQGAHGCDMDDDDGDDDGDTKAHGICTVGARMAR
jgi:hypothetical protein